MLGGFGVGITVGLISTQHIVNTGELQRVKVSASSAVCCLVRNCPPGWPGQVDYFGQDSMIDQVLPERVAPPDQMGASSRCRSSPWHATKNSHTDSLERQRITSMTAVQGRICVRMTAHPIPGPSAQVRVVVVRQATLLPHQAMSTCTSATQE